MKTYSKNLKSSTSFPKLLTNSTNLEEIFILNQNNVLPIIITINLIIIH